MKTLILPLALGIVAASSMAAYATENPYHRVHRHRQMVQQAQAQQPQWYDPFKPRTTNGLSRNRDACASYGCVGAGGGGD
jgi:hypothetical protein